MSYQKIETPAGTIYWDQNLGLRSNINANLKGFDSPELGDFEGYMEAGLTKSEQEAAQALLDKFETLQRTQPKDKYIADNGFWLAISSIMNDLPSHRKGKPSLLYAILKHAMQESTNLHEKRLGELDQEFQKEDEKKNKSRDEFFKSEDELSASMKTERDLQKRNIEVKKEVEVLREKENALKEKEKRLIEHFRLVKGNIEKLEKTAAELNKREKLPVSPQQSISHRGAYSNGLKKRIESQETDKAAALERKEKSKINLEVVRGNNVNLTDLVERSRTCLYSISAVGSLNYPTDRKHEADKLGTFARMIKDLWRKKFTVPEPSKGESDSGSEAGQEKEGENEGILSQMVTIDTGDNKSFEWDLAQGICGNMERLMGWYIKSPGYHSPDRVKSAKKILGEIQSVRNNADLKDEKSKDLALMRFIREQNVGSHGFNRKKSLLHRIYQEAESRYRDAVKNDVEGKKNELKSVKRESESLSKSSRRAKKSFQSSSNRSANLQERTGIYLNQREELKDKIEKQKQLNKKIKKALKDAREVLLRKQGEVLAQSVQVNSSQKTLKAEAAFVNEHLGLLVKSKELVEDTEALQDEVAEMDEESRRAEAQNGIDAESIQTAYIEIKALSKKCGGVEMVEVEDIGDLDAVVKSLEDFTRALQEKAQYAALDSSSDEELSRDTESDPSGGSSEKENSDWNPFI